MTPARPWATPARPDATLARDPTAAMTPAKAAGGASFVTDVATQGPTDPAQRQAACVWKASLPQGGNCVDCGDGPTPFWLKRATGLAGILGERVTMHGVEICCFS